MFILVFFLMCTLVQIVSYDPDDKFLKDILLPEGKFESFYFNNKEDSVVRPPHLHGSYHKHKNPALINVPNSAAYGFRFDGQRRFNFNK